MTDTTQRPGSGAPSGWDAAPAPTTPLPAHDQQAPSAAPSWSSAGRSPYDVRSPYDIGGPPAPGAPVPGTRRQPRPRAPWFWPVVVAAVGLGALLAGGGAGFALGHVIGSHQQQSDGGTTGRPGADPFGGRQGSDPFGGRQGSGPSGGSDGGTQQLPGGGSISPQGGSTSGGGSGS